MPIWDYTINNLVGGLVSIKVMESGFSLLDKTSKKGKRKKGKKGLLNNLGF